MPNIASEDYPILLTMLATVSALILASCQPETPVSSEDSTSSAVTLWRQVSLEGQSNFRDLGGYQTKDGKTVKKGILFRSGELPSLTETDVQTLAAIPVKTVVNFLTKNEIARRGPDNLPAGTKEVFLPIDHDSGQGSLTDGLIVARKTGDFSNIPVTLNTEIHRILTKEATQEYAALIRLALEPDNLPLAFHCSHGVHRTGTASAIILSALGVPWETIRDDYLLSNTLRSKENEKRLFQLRELAATNQGIPTTEVDTTNMEAFYILQPSYIDATLDTIRNDYGSIDAYLRDGLGLSEDELARLRQQLLE